MLDSLKTKTPLSKIVTAILFILMTGMIIGSYAISLDNKDFEFASICGWFLLIIVPLVSLYCYSIYKTVDFVDKNKRK